MKKNIPDFWKTELDDIETIIKHVEKGKLSIVGTSAGGRPIYLIRYGEKNCFNRTANFSSALGARDRACYADKSQEEYKPTIFLVGCVHGGEFEGTAALLNLISIMETGCDEVGTEFENLRALCEKVNLLIIPCANPDGRSRIPFKSMVGKTFEELRYYNQGTWKDGSLAGWPECKKIHPIKEAAGFLGAYFNDDGINMMHDDFFGEKAAETKILFDIVDEYVPDLTILLHGGTNAENHIITTAYAPLQIKKKIGELEKNLIDHLKNEGIPMFIPDENMEEYEVPTSFNLPSALYQFSGEACITYESNQGLNDSSAPALSYEQIYKSHMILFEEAVKKLLNDFNIERYSTADFSTVTCEDWKVARDNWRRFLVGDENNDLSNEYVCKNIAQLDHSCEEAWSNLHKETKILALFGTQACVTSGNMTRTQFRLLEALAKAYATFGSKYYHNEKLRKDILFALDWLYENLYGQAEIEGRGWRDTQDCDWWDWYVGSLHPLVHTLLFMEGYVSNENIKKYLSLYNHLRTTKMEFTAVSPASRSYGGTLAALLEEDAKRMEALTKEYDAMLQIDNESPNGIHEDWCYRGHTYLAYTTLYGAATILERLVVLKYILNGTRFEINSSLSHNLCRCIYETFNPMLFGGVATMAQRGRHRDNEIAPTVEIVRGMLRCVGAFEKEDDVRIKSMIKRNVNDFNRDKIFAGLNVGEMARFARILNDDAVKPEQIKRSKIYYTGDSVMHHMDNDRGFALQMSSTRIAGWESIDEENGNGWYLGDGFLYMYVKGREGSYSSSYWKNVNMYHLPGTTVDTQKRIDTNIADNSKALMENDFAGACGIYGQYTTAAMQLISWRNDVEEELSKEGYGGGAPLRKCTLEAKKAWFMFDDEVVALGADINANDGFEVHTVVENRILKGGEKILAGETVMENSDEFSHQFSDVPYLHLENVAGFVFCDNGNLFVKKVHNNEKFIEAWFNHGLNPSDGKYSYIILPGKTQQETIEYSQNPHIEILENNKKIQAVRKTQLGCTGIVFWESGSFENITTASAMIVMKGEKDNGEVTVSVCDPTQLLEKSALIIRGSFSVIDSDIRITTINSGESIIAELDFKKSLGRTLELNLKKEEKR